MGGVMLEGFEVLLTSLFQRPGPSTLYGDNSASIYLGHGQGSWRSRAYANRAAGIRSRVKSGDLILAYVGTKEQRADGLTKSLSVPLLSTCRTMFGLGKRF